MVSGFQLLETFQRHYLQNVKKNLLDGSKENSSVSQCCSSYGFSVSYYHS